MSAAHPTINPTLGPLSVDQRMKRSIDQFWRLFERCPSDWPTRYHPLNNPATLWMIVQRATGNLSFRVHRLDKLDWSEPLKAGQSFRSTREREEHVVKKYAARQWLSARVKSPIRFEGWYGPFRGDVMTGDGTSISCVVEVGHTQTAKAFMAALEGVQFFLLPYRYDFDTAPERSVIIEFVVNEAAKDAAISGYEQWLRQ